MVKSKQEGVHLAMLTPEQLSKLQALAEPERWVDETFDHTKIGAFLLHEHLIAPNPEPGARKAYLVTSEGHRTLKDAAASLSGSAKRVKRN